MGVAVSAKKLLTKENQKRYKNFSLNLKDNGETTESLYLRQVSSVPWVAASQRSDVYKKKVSHPDSPHHVKFISKNNYPHAFLWQTSAAKIKQGVRWGIIKTQSATGKVISTLGQYRLAVHERAAKGMVSNTQAVKLKLLDLFQDRFEALEELESLANKNNTIEDYQKVINHYIKKLKQISNDLEQYFNDVDMAGLDKQSLKQIRDDIQADINRAEAYLTTVHKNQDNLRSYNRARGQNSIIEFVKHQMIQGLYELQGINQDLTYSRKRYFALTRGTLNDWIEDARIELEDQSADLRNAVRPSHHGQFSENQEDTLIYDFSEDELSPARQRQVLLGISFIEGWDVLENKKGQPAVIKNNKGTESLDVIAATSWKNHRSFKAFVKSFAYFLFNCVKSFFVATRPWEEEDWNDKKFHLVAADLRKHAEPNEPMWLKPVKFIKQLGYALVDIFNGIKDFGSTLVVKMPSELIDDWNSTEKTPPMTNTLQSLSEKIAAIRKIEETQLEQLLQQCRYKPTDWDKVKPGHLAEMEYPLSIVEQNDILTAVARGLYGFSSVFTRSFAKDPIAADLFFVGYAIGAAVIYLPSFSTSIFGAAYVNWLSKFSYAMGSSKFAATIGGGCTQAQAFATIWDGIMHGPNGMAMNALYQFGEDPLTVGTYVAAAYGLGYVLANGIAGYPIPWVSEHVKADLGDTPESGYPFIGAKFAIMFYEALLSEKTEEFKAHPLNFNGEELEQFKEKFYAENKELIDRFTLALFLSMNVEIIPQLDSSELFELSRQIDTHFSEEESRSLKQILYPETHPSIAFQIFSIPLSYIPAVLRCAISIVLSLVAWAMEKPNCWQPLIRAGGFLVEKVKKDVSRLVVFTSYATILIYGMCSSIVKAFSYTAALAIGRIGGLFDSKPAHAIHRGFAAIHKFCRTVGEFFYMARLVKDVTTAHHMHVIKETEESYGKLINKLADKNPRRDDSEQHLLDLPSSFNLLQREKMGQSMDSGLDAIRLKERRGFSIGQ